MRLPARARLVIAVAVAGGLVAIALALRSLAAGPHLQPWQLAVAAVFGAMALASWVRPLIVYIGSESEAVHLDEGFLVILLLVVPPGLTVLTFAVATALAQVVMRRGLVKSAFNTGQLLVAVGSAALVFGLAGDRHTGFNYRDVAAAFAAAAVFFLVNNAAMTAILSSTGASVRESLRAGLHTRIVLNLSGAGVAVCLAFLLAASPIALPMVLLPLLVLRYTLGGFIRARHDRTRLEGLFQATLEANHSIGQEPEDVKSALLGSARSLLRCNEAELSDAPLDLDGLAACVSLLGETQWLSVSGRSRTEPFDRADHSLLEALAAVGTGALSNAALYRQSQRRRERLAAITSSLGEGVCAISRSGRVTFVNKAATEMLGWELSDELDEERLLDDPEAGIPAPDFLVAAAMRALTTSETVASYDTRFWKADGSPLEVACTVAPTVEAGAAVGAVIVFRDVSEQRQLAELSYQAFHDPLTGLANRRQFLDSLSESLRRGQANGERHAVLFVDIDRFKIINDSLGHHAGDVLLISIADRIRKVLPDGAVLARFGGDEFTVLLPAVQGLEETTSLAEQILDRMREPIGLVDGHEVVASLSIGIALTSARSTGDDVLHDADVAMYVAKESGRSGHYRVFDCDTMGGRSAERLELELELRLALESNQLETFYQPLFSLFDERIVAVEALVRWNHPRRGLLLPGEFIDMAEETGLILAVGKTVLEQACAKAVEWRDRLGITVPVGVNLSARQFQNAGLLEDIEKVLASTGLQASQLCFEITETLAMAHVDETADVLATLKALGASVAIDDFGTGYSALGYLARFPTDVVKIDRSFVKDVETDAVKSAIVSAVLTMANAIGSTTVVEGVETGSQLEHLRALGCSVGQGYHFASPMSGRQVDDLLATSCRRRRQRPRNAPFVRDLLRELEPSA